MTDQESGAVNPAQAIYDALSDKAKDAVDALPDDVFVDNEGVDHAARFKESISIIHRRQPGAWTVLSWMPQERFTALSVQNFNVISLSDKFRFVVLEELVDIAELDGPLANYVSWNEYAEGSGRLQVEIDLTTSERARDALWRAHKQMLARLGEANWRRNSKYKLHRDDVRVKLALQLQADVPNPAYVEPSDAGLSRRSDSGLPAWLRLEHSAIAARELARAIRTAHGVHSSSWALTLAGEYPRLNVQGLNVVAVDSRQVTTIVNEEALQGHPDLNPTLTPKKLGNGAREVVIQPGMDGDGLLTLHRLNDEVITSWAGITNTRAQRAGEHRPEMIEALAAFLGEPLPQPGYIDSQSGDLGYLPADLSALAQGFTSEGLTHTDAQIASFYTALQTKGFVILSGISGTGKSKIAQRFADLLPDISVRISTPKSSNTFHVKYQQYMKDHGQIRLLNEVSSLLPVPDDGEAYNIPMSINGQDGTCRFWTRPPKYGGTYIHPHGALKAALMELDHSGFWLRFVTDKDESRVDRIVLTTDAANQVLRVDQSLELRSNKLFLPVRPDWRDGKALIGYHNPLTGDYARTDFLDFVIAAGDDHRAGNRNAFFVILDEMNLAHVEYYFADVLSVIESGRDAEGWTVEGIPLAVGEEDADLPDVLRLPPNLYIVGTVNMDETTHPFSPKVLDRAFTIELTDVDFSDYPPQPVDGDVDLSEEERQALLRAFTRNGRYPRIDKAEIGAVVEDHPGFRDDLATLNRGLERYRMHFGYRVFDEIMQFVHNAEDNRLFTSAEDAFDHAVLMKVLPKFNGSRAKLENALFELLHWARTDGAISSDARSQLEARLGQLSEARQPFDSIVVTGTGSVEDDWRYPATGGRAALMMQDLYTDGFASFG